MKLRNETICARIVIRTKAQVVAQSALWHDLANWEIFKELISIFQQEQKKSI